jgi:flagellar motor switch protein FliG
MASDGQAIRKAAILVRTLDAHTAETLLSQLAPAEAAAVREAVRTVGIVRDEEQAEVLTAFRRATSTARQSSVGGVELELSSDAEHPKQPVASQVPEARGKRFEFLEHAPVSTLATCLAREHAQTVAVVLSNLAPARAADVLAALPDCLQAEAIERLSSLGETDPESVAFVERELAAWLEDRTGQRDGRPRRDAISAIFAAADATSRAKLLAGLRIQKSPLAQGLLRECAGETTVPRRSPRHYTNGAAASKLPTVDNPDNFVNRRVQQPGIAKATAARASSHGRTAHAVRTDATSRQVESEVVATQAALNPPQITLPPFEFDDLIHLDGAALAEVLRQADANLLALSLSASRDELIDRICGAMPKPVARKFRRELTRLGPTLLSDVASAQAAVALLARKLLAKRQRERCIPPPTQRPRSFETQHPSLPRIAT